MCSKCNHQLLFEHNEITKYLSILQTGRIIRKAKKAETLGLKKNLAHR